MHSYLTPLTPPQPEAVPDHLEPSNVNSTVPSGAISSLNVTNKIIGIGFGQHPTMTPDDEELLEEEEFPETDEPELE
ncbi:hypothetical protein [Zavarzinella formosa]|uniref:hypothetical protein n=1 Tax=Zavarzinella formosa TaxID=360055 RepID=UPI0003805285|nr:hypothetical protein [Zavarzinella formosa]